MAAGRFYVVMDPQEVTDVDEGASGRLSVRFQGGAKSATVAGEVFPLNAFARTGPYAPAVSAGYILELATDVATGGDPDDSAVGYDLTWTNGDGEVHALFVGQPADSIVNLSDLAASETIPLAVSSANAERAENAADAAVAAAAAVEAVVATSDGIVAAALADDDSDSYAATANIIDNKVGTPTDTGFDVILLAGQSNMSGRGTEYDIDTTDPLDSRIWQYGATGDVAGFQSVAREPLAMHDTPTGIGPGLQYARWNASHLPLGRRILLVPAAHGGTGFAAGTLRWKVGHGTLFEDAVAQTRAALAAAGPNARLSRILWHQGEFDGITSGRAAAYEANLDEMIAAFRTEFGAGVPFILGQMVPEGLTTEWRSTVNAVHVDTPDRVSNTAFAYGLPGAQNGDDTHYNAIGARFMGRAMHEAAQALAAGTTVTVPAGTPVATAGGVTESTAVLSWTTITGAIGYSIESSPAGAGTWTPAGAAIGNSTLVEGLTPATAYDLRVVPYNSAGRGTPSALVAATTTEDVSAVYDVAARAYSLSKVVEAYSGNCIRVRRSSDNTEANIGFSGTELDTAALLAHVGANDGYVVTVFDQGTAGINITQATTTAQPKIVTAGVVEEVDGHPCIVFDGTSDYLSAADSLYDAGAATVAMVVAGTVGTAPRVYAEGNSASANTQYAATFAATTTGNPASLIRNDANSTLLSTSGSTAPAPLFDDTLHQNTMIDTGTSLQHWVDGGSGGSAAYTRSGTLSLTTFAVGALVRNTVGSFAAMRLVELVAWHSALDSSDRGSVEADQTSRFGTP